MKYLISIILIIAIYIFLEKHYKIYIPHSNVKSATQPGMPVKEDTPIKAKNNQEIISAKPIKRKFHHVILKRLLHLPVTFNMITHLRLSNKISFINGVNIDTSIENFKSFQIPFTGYQVNIKIPK